MRNYAKKRSISFYKSNFKDLPEDADIVQNTHSLPHFVPGNKDLKGVHLYRDPYDMLLSNIKYHEITESPTEGSNIIKIEGMAYKDFLKQLDGLNNKAIFEIKNIFGRTLQRMLDWDYTDKRFINLDLENFAGQKLQDSTNKIADHFGLNEEKKSDLYQSFVAANNNKTLKKHATKTPGTPSNTSNALSDEVHTLLNVMFPSLEAFRLDNKLFSQALKDDLR